MRASVLLGCAVIQAMAMGSMAFMVGLNNRMVTPGSKPVYAQRRSSSIQVRQQLKAWDNIDPVD